MIYSTPLANFHLSCGPTLRHALSAVSEGWNLGDSKINVWATVIAQNKHMSYCNTVIVFPLQIWSMHLLLFGSTLSVKSIHILFWRMLMINLKPNCNDPVSGSIGLHFRLKQKSHTLPNWWVIFPGQLTEHDLGNGIWNDSVFEYA